MFEPMSISIGAYRSLKGIHLPWDRSIALFGKNASGKTSILKAVDYYFNTPVAEYYEDNAYQMISCTFDGPDIRAKISLADDSRSAQFHQSYKAWFVLKAMGFSVDLLDKEPRIAFEFRLDENGDLEYGDNYFMIDSPRLKAKAGEGNLASFALAPGADYNWVSRKEDFQLVRLGVFLKRPSTSEIGLRGIELPDGVATRESELVASLMNVQWPDSTFIFMFGQGCNVDAELVRPNIACEGGIDDRLSHLFKLAYAYGQDIPWLDDDNKPKQSEIWVLVEIDMGLFVDVERSLSHMLDSEEALLPLHLRDHWRQILDTCINHIGLQIERYGSSATSYYCITGDFIEAVKKSGHADESSLQEYADFFADNDSQDNDLSETFSRWVLDSLKESYRNRLETPAIPEEFHPLNRMCIFVGAGDTRAASQYVESSIERRFDAIRHALKEFTESGEMHSGDFEFEDLDVSSYLIKIFKKPDEVFRIYLEEIQRGLNEWLVRFLSDVGIDSNVASPISAEVSMLNDASVRIMVRDFGAEEFRPLEEVSSGARRWTTASVGLACSRFDALTSIYEQETLKSLVSYYGGKQGEMLDLQIFDQFDEGEFGKVEGCIHILERGVYSGDFLESIKPILLIDEPEMHIHPGLHGRLTQSLGELGNRFKLLLATHSMDFLSIDEASCDFYLVEREGSSSITIPVSTREHQALDRLAIAIGATKGELLQAFSLILFVEGEHDKVFFNNLLGDELSQRHVYIVPIRGTKKMASLKTALEILSPLVRSPKMLLVDNGKNQLVKDINDPEALAKAVALWRTQDRTRSGPLTGEEKSIIDIKSTYPDLITFTLSKKDICMYIPEFMIKEDHRDFPDSWETVLKESKKKYRELKRLPENKNNPNFQYNVKDQSKAYGFEISTKVIEDMAMEMHDQLTEGRVGLHDDFIDLLHAIDQAVFFQPNRVE